MAGPRTDPATRSEVVDSRTAPEVGNRDHRRRSAPRRDRRYRPARLPRRRDGTTRDARPSDCRCSIPTSATTKFVDEQGEGASPAGACVSRPAASAAAATPTAHAAGIAARVPTRIRLRARPPRGGSPGVCPRTRGSCPTIPVARCRGSPRPAVNPATLHTATITPEVSGTVTVDIAAGAAQDSSGNSSAAADQFSITANTAAPTVTITSSASEPVTGAFSIAVTFSEPVNGFELADLVVGNGNASGLQGRRRGRSPDRGRPGRQPWPPQPRAPIIRVHAPHGLHSRRHSSHLRRSLPVSARRSFQAHQFNRTQ